MDPRTSWKLRSSIGKSRAFSGVGVVIGRSVCVLGPQEASALFRPHVNGPSEPGTLDPSGIPRPTSGTFVRFRALGHDPGIASRDQDTEGGAAALAILDPHATAVEHGEPGD